MRALQFKPISFGCDAILSPIVVNTPCGSCSVVSVHSVVIPQFLPFSLYLCIMYCICAMCISTVGMCHLQTLCLRSDERKAFPLVFTWTAAFLYKLDDVVLGQGGEKVFDKDQNKGVPRWLCGLAFLMGSNLFTPLLTATALCPNGFLESTPVHL